MDVGGRLRPHWQWLVGELSLLGTTEVQRRWQLAQKQIANDGITFNPHDMAGGASRPWILDAVPLVLDEVGMAADGRGARTAGAVVRSDAAGSVRSAEPAARAGAAAGRAVRSSRFLSRVSRTADAERAEPDDVRQPTCACSRRPLVGDGGSDAGAVRPGLRAREPHRHVADVSAGVSQVSGAATGVVLRRFAGDAAGDGSAVERESPHRALVEGTAEPGLLRRRLPGPLSGLHAGRGGRSGRP